MKITSKKNDAQLSSAETVSPMTAVQLAQIAFREVVGQSDAGTYTLTIEITEGDAKAIADAKAARTHVAPAQPK